jgi:hypothetical protein
VRFPDGTLVRASALSERRERDPQRDYGLYLDPGWRPTWPADVVPWKDLGLPLDPEVAATRIRDAFLRAKRGERVEVGCRFGLGRTGTVLACMAVLAGVPPTHAVAWVRQHYRRAAVETPEQEAWVLWFAAHLSRIAEGEQ